MKQLNLKKFKIPAIIITLVVVILGTVAIINPKLLTGLFGFSGESTLGKYVVNTGQNIDVYSNLDDLIKAETEKATGVQSTVTVLRNISEKEIFGLEAIKEQDGKSYAYILFSDANNNTIGGYITKEQLDGMTTKQSIPGYTVIFAEKDGQEYARQAIQTGGKASAVDATKPGYVLSGWHFEGKAWNFDDVVTKDMTLTPNWVTATQVKNYKVSYDLSGGVLESASTIPVQEVPEGAKATNPGNPTKEDYKFKGWVNSDTNTCAAIGCELPLWDFNTPITKDMTLVATFSSLVEDKMVFNYITNMTNPATGWSNRDVSLTLKVSALEKDDSPESLAYSFDGGQTWTDRSQMYIKTTTDINVAARTRKGYISKKVIPIKIDRDKPNAPVYTLKTADGRDYNGGFVDQKITLSDIKATDNGESGIDYFEYSAGCYETNKWEKMSDTYVYDPKEKTYNITFCIRAVDKAGNRSPATSKLVIQTTMDLAKPIIKVTGNPTKWTKQDVAIRVNVANDNTVPLAELAYSFDGGRTYQRSSVKTFKNNTSFSVVVKASTGALSEIVPVEINRIDKIAPIVKVTKIADRSAGNNGIKAVYWVRVEAKDNISKVFTTGSYRYSNSEWKTLNGIYTKIFEQKGDNGATLAGAKYIHLQGTGNKWQDSLDGYYKLQSNKGNHKTRAYIVVRDEAGNVRQANFPGNTSWFQ